MIGPILFAVLTGVTMLLVLNPLYLSLSMIPQPVPKKQRYLRRIFKGGATFMAVLLALTAAVRSPSFYSVFILIAVTLCMISDVVLDISFLPGVGSFLSAHLFFIPAFLSVGRFVAWQSLPLFLGVYGVTYILFRKDFPHMGKMLLPCMVYIGVLAVMFSVGFPTLRSGEPALIVAATGCLCFVVSDLTLGKNVFVRVTRFSDAFCLTVYYCAVYLISLSSFVRSL